MSLVNPFSGEAMKLLEGFDSANEVPDKIYQLALEIVESEIDQRKARRLISPTPEQIQDDTLSLHLILRSVAIKYGYPSVEGRTALELIKKLVRERMWSTLNDALEVRAQKFRVEEVILHFSEVLEPKPITSLGEGQLLEDIKAYSPSIEDKNVIRYALPKDRVLPLLRNAERRLTDLYLMNGHIAASLNDMVDYYCESIGMKALEVLSKSWQIDDPRSNELAELVSKLPSRLQRTFAPFAHKGGSRGGRTLVIDHFSPCIKNTLGGVTTGSRNYAITVLLTSFLSYARIAPIGANKDDKISDHLMDISAVENEVLRMIDEAARLCVPPLFEDQPMERMNVIYHLGFGLTNEPKIDDAGKSHWYFPPNCDKIQREAPSLCTPDAHCKTIKNPLSYYTKKLFPKKVKGKKEKTAKSEKAA